MYWQLNVSILKKEKEIRTTAFQPLFIGYFHLGKDYKWSSDIRQKPWKWLTYYNFHFSKISNISSIKENLFISSLRPWEIAALYKVWKWLLIAIFWLICNLAKQLGWQVTIKISKWFWHKTLMWRNVQHIEWIGRKSIPRTASIAQLADTRGQKMKG